MRVLVQVADPGLLADVQCVVRSAGYATAGASSTQQSLTRIQEMGADAALVEVLGAEGLESIDRLRAAAPGIRVVAMCARPAAARIVAAQRRGACGLLRMPFDVTSLEQALARAAARPGSETAETRFLSRDPATLRVMEQIELAATSDATVLIVGEVGTGKGMLARRLHQLGRRCAAPLVRVACGSVGERELFGPREAPGAEGLLPAAHGGTLLLEDVGALPLGIQPRLLRVLQERRVRGAAGALGDLDLRVVATSGLDLRSEVRADRFREDLYYRLDVIRLAVPPLRARPADVALLAEAFLERFARRHGLDPAWLDGAAHQALAARPLRGNVRELENLMRRAALLFPGASVDVERLDTPAPGTAHPLPLPWRSFNLRTLERETIARSLEATGGNRTLASRALGISVRTLRNKIRLYDLA